MILKPPKNYKINKQIVGRKCFSRVDYKFDDSFSVATSTARLAFVGREFFTCSSLSLRQSSFCFRELSCSVRISEASGGWCSCSKIRLTSGLVTLIEASYSEDEVTTGSVNPRPPCAQGDEGGRALLYGQ